MTPPDPSHVRPEFDSIHLDVDAAETRWHVEQTVRGLVASETDEGVRYRTRGGTLVAVVAQGQEAEPDRSELAYRVAPASEPATRKASKIRDALTEYSVV
jgi:hypothetical protein